MRSRTSSSEPGNAAREKLPGSWFNGTLFRSNLARFWPLWALYAIVWAVLLPLMQFASLHNRGGTTDPEDLLYGLKAVFLYGGLWMSAIFGVLVAMALFSYLTTARSVGLMHTLPIRREGLFLTNYLSGLFLFLSTHAAVLLATVLVDLSAVPSFGSSFAAEYWKVLGLGFAVLTLLSLFFYSFAVFCAQFTGQILAIPVFYAILNVLVIGLDFLVRTFAGLSLYGIRGSEGYSGWALWLSPLVYLARKLRLVSVWDEAAQQVVHYDTTGLPAVFAYGAAGLLLAALALAAYRTRRSETAGDTVAVRWARPVFKYGVAVCCALGLGQGLYALTWGQYQHTGGHSLTGVLVCMLLMGLVGYYAAEMLLKKSFRIFRTSWKGAAALAVCLLLFGVGTDADVFGVENRVPELSRIQNVIYQISGRYFVSGNVSDPGLIGKLRGIHEEVLSEKDTQRQRAEAGAVGDGENGFYLTLFYTLKNGSVLNRSYNLYYTDDELENGTSSAGLLNAFCSEPSVQKSQLFGEGTVTKTVTGGEYDYIGPGELSGVYTIGAEEGEALYEAVLRDIDAGRFNNDVVSQETFGARQYQNRLTLYLVTEGEDGRQRTETRDIPLNTGCTDTISALKELGIVTEERPLMTYDEYSAAYGTSREYAEKFGMAAATYAAEAAVQTN